MERNTVDNGTENRESNRFTAQQVEQIEKSLDSEYVPFYFQDLRTNEFIGLHAFIASVNESFSPTYGESTPYGRIDPVMTYGSTRREFSLSFHVVSTSPDDFDLMYVKLNKLSTLLYPQFTRGRSVVDSAGKQFIQPFSQIPGASPLCRIRLGNLMKTNFTNLSMARLFGLGSQEFIDGNPTPAPAATDFDKIVNLLRQQIEATGFAPGQEAVLSPYGFKQLNDRASILPAALSGVQNEEIVRNFGRIATRPSLVTIKTRGQTRSRGELVGLYTVEFNEPGLTGVTLTVPETALGISMTEVQKQLSLINPTIPGADDEKLAFFEPSNNSIVRSFRNTRGKGLAGFITSLTMDWNEANGNWDTDRFFARAPQLCKIDLSFTVIHDIPPGLDADGFNRAPIWPTGDIMGRLGGDAYDSNGFSEDYYKDRYGRIKGKI
jgi:hypothetical protein